MPLPKWCLCGLFLDYVRARKNKDGPYGPYCKYVFVFEFKEA